MFGRGALLLFLIALVPRVLYLNDWPSIFYDEGNLIIAGQNLHKGILGSAVFGPSITPPAGVLISVALPVSLFFQRMPYAVMGAFSCIVLYYIVRTHGEKLAILSSILLALYPVAVFINRTAEPVTGTELFFLLTIFFYLRRKGKMNWLLCGICAGLAFLFNYTGVIAFFFIFFQSLIDRSLKANLKILGVNLLTAGAFLSEIAVMGLTGFRNQFFVYGTSNTFSQALNNLVFGYPYGQTLPPVLTLGLRFFIAVSFLSSALLVLALIAFPKSSRISKEFFVAAFIASIVIFYFASGLFFWALFIIVLPLYCLAIAKLVLSNMPLIALAVVLFLFVSGFFVYGYSVTNFSPEQTCTISYLSPQKGLVAANPSIAAYLPNAYNYMDVIFYSHPFNYHEYHTSLISSFHKNLNISSFSYFVVDGTLAEIASGSPVVANFSSYVQSHWNLVKSCGQYQIYER